VLSAPRGTTQIFAASFFFCPINDWDYVTHRLLILCLYLDVGVNLTGFFLTFD
jgi:hypothetical protein